MDLGLLSVEQGRSISQLGEELRQIKEGRKRWDSAEGDSKAPRALARGSSGDFWMVRGVRFAPDKVQMPSKETLQY